MRHFVWQADAWLHGRFAISWPVSSGPLPNDFYLDVVPVPGQPGFGRTPYRPLPAIVILPAVASSDWARTPSSSGPSSVPSTQASPG